MARLKVRLRGKTVHDVALADDKSYIVGRKEDCDIVLAPEKGISREHFKISSQNGQWSLELVSKYGDVLANGEKVQELNLEHGQNFSVPPYEFEFLMSSADTSSMIARQEMALAENDMDEKTFVGPSASLPFIKVVDANGEAKEMFKLDGGDTWTAGREASCHILIRDQRVSRKQFEIRKMNSQYYIIDLESVNGTLLNGNPVSTSEPEPIRSGDSISVLNNHFFFELHDPHFKSRMELVNLAPMNPISPLGQYASDLVPYEASLPAATEIAAPATLEKLSLIEKIKQYDYKKNKKVVIAGAAVFLLLCYGLFSDDHSSKPATPVVTDAFSKLKPEQQILVKQSYQLAKNLYMQGKYELAQNEITKIQEIIPDYEDLKDIQRLAREAIYIQDQKRRQEEIEKAKAEAEEKILHQTEICKKKIGPDSTTAQLDECLSPVLQFNPDHPKIAELRSMVEAITMRRQAKNAEQAAYQEQVARLRRLYDSAKKLEKEGKNPDAIKAYQVVVNSRLPDPRGLKNQSATDMQNVRNMMNSKTAVYQRESEKAYQTGNLKLAILALRKARQIDPENDELPEKIERYTLELKKQMMVHYQEGILEESFGNVEGSDSKQGAKDKWKKIIELDIPDGEYYKKAYLKLKKYGNY